MYSTANGTVTDAEAAEIDSLNNEIWKNFWSIPREKRTKADWEKLLDIQILVKKEYHQYLLLLRLFHTYQQFY